MGRSRGGFPCKVHCLGDANAVRNRLKEDGGRATIPSKPGRVNAIRGNMALHRDRSRIERMIGRLKINRAVATRDEKIAKSVLDALYMALNRKCLRIAAL